MDNGPVGFRGLAGLIGHHHMCMCAHTHTHMRHRRTQFIIKYLAYFAARLRASAYYNNISGQLPACLVAVGDKNP